MKLHTKTIVCLTAALGASTIFTACGDEEFTGQITGVVMMVTTDGGLEKRVEQVRADQHVNLTIGAAVGQRSDLRIVNISGVDYAPDVIYKIDGQEVGTSSDYAKFFALPYDVKNLSLGQHTLSVEVPKTYHNITYVVDVKSSTFEVVE